MTDSGSERSPRARRYLHVLNGLPFGGNETLCLTLMKRLPSDRRLLLNIGADGGMREKFEALGDLTLFSIEYRRRARLRFVRQVTTLLRELRPDGIVVYPFGLHVFIALAARLAGVSNVIVHAGNPPPEDEARRRTWRAIVRASRLLGTPIISCSRYVDDEFRRLCSRMPKGSCVVHNGIDVDEVARRAEITRQGRLDDRPVVGMIGRLNIIKDQATLLRAMARVIRTIPDAVLWIVGDGETRDGLERLSRDLGLDHAVKFWGKRGDAPELLGQMDVYVFSTSRDEGFGIAIVEALAAGLPVVASDVSACREVLDAGNAGVLVRAGDDVGMAAAIERLVKSEPERRQWAEKARARAQLFSDERCVSRWLALLEGGEC